MLKKGKKKKISFFKEVLIAIIYIDELDKRERKKRREIEGHIQKDRRTAREE